MIVDVKRGNLLTESTSPVAFCVNSAGANDAGFAGQVAFKCWPELAAVGATELGHVRPWMNDDGRLFYALCVHTMNRDGWERAPELLYDCLQRIKGLAYSRSPARWPLAVPSTLAMPLPGSGMVGQMQGADVMANLGALARADIEIEVWTL